MPVNVLSLDLNSGRQIAYYATTSSNPSYSLREAIAQYAPGNSVVVDGIVYIVRGIGYTNMYKQVNTFKKIYRNAVRTVIDNAELPKKLRWGVNGREDLEFIEPTAFLPDCNEDYSRITGATNYTRVSAQLIGTSEWSDSTAEDNLYSVRNNKDTGDAKILYYNEGLGYGYCFCTRCGRMVAETEAAENAVIPERLPPAMNDHFSKEPDKPKFHFAIGGRDIRKCCAGSYDKAFIRRNVIIGGLLQTDYSEIKLRHKKSEKWIGTRDGNEGMLYTLGIVFTQCLLDVLGKERGAVDFAITPNGHICIFDTNPGGSGYANQLIKPDLMKKVILAARVVLEDAKRQRSVDMLLDKFTVRYLRYIDVNAALNWVNAQNK
jgi:DEAD/DEAH box helicase domain-containing protein